MADLNSISIAGRLTDDPKMDYTESGHKKASFAVAVDNYGKDAGASFFPVELWGNRGETLAEHLRKGDWIGLVGRMEQVSWTTNEGEKRSRWILKASDFSFVGKKADR